MGVTFESHGAGVTVKDADGRILGVAHPYGAALSSASALAQLGYVEDDTAPGGVRRVHEGVTVLTPQESLDFITGQPMPGAPTPGQGAS